MKRNPGSRLISSKGAASKSYGVRTLGGGQAGAIRHTHGTKLHIGRPVRFKPRLQTCTDDRERFRTLVQEWRKATARFSNLAKVVDDPSSAAVIDFPNAEKYLLDELRAEPSRLVYLLRRLTRTDPYKGEPGDIVAMTEAWLAWSASRRTERMRNGQSSISQKPAP